MILFFVLSDFFLTKAEELAHFALITDLGGGAVFIGAVDFQVCCKIEHTGKIKTNIQRY